MIFECKGHLRDHEIDNSLPASSVKFPMPMMNYKLAPPLSTKFFNVNKFFKCLDLDVLLTNPNSFPCKCNNSLFADSHHFVQRMKFSIKDLFSKYDQIRSFLRIWSHLLKKYLMGNLICAVSQTHSSRGSTNN